MNKFVTGAVCTVIGAVGFAKIYEMGYNKGVKDCKKVLEFFNEITNSDKKKES